MVERPEGDNRTKKLIRRALLECLEERSFEDVTVMMVAERAEVNRSTIYRYYDSVFSILGDCIYQITGKADQRIPDGDDPFFFGKIRETITVSARDIRDNSDLYALVYRYPGKLEKVSPQSRFLRERSDVFYRDLVSILLRRGAQPVVPHAYLGDLLGSASGTIINRWIEDGYREAPEEIADYTVRAFEGLAGIPFVDGADISG